MRDDLSHALFPPPQRSRSLISVLLKALFIALVSFGGPAGVLTALFPRPPFGLTASLACPRDTEMVFDQWNDGDSTQFGVYCVNQAGEVSRDRTLAAVGWVMAFFFIAALYIALAVLLVGWLRERH